MPSPIGGVADKRMESPASSKCSAVSTHLRHLQGDAGVTTLDDQQREKEKGDYLDWLHCCFKQGRSPKQHAQGKSRRANEVPSLKSLWLDNLK